VSHFDSPATIHLAPMRCLTRRFAELIGGA